MREPEGIERFERWIAFGERWFSNDHPLFQLSVQMLAYAEGPILGLEAELARMPRQPHIAQGMMLMQCSSLSVFWLFGLYEALRTLRARDRQRFAPLGGIFREVELARMPLAKHQAKNGGKHQNVEHYPTSTWNPETGRVGWIVFDPGSDAMITVARTDIADRLLDVEP